MRTIITLLGFIRPYWWVLPGLVALGLISSLAEGLGIGLLIPLISVFLQGQSEDSDGLFGALQAIGSGLEPESRLLLITGCILGLILLKTLVIGAFYGLSAWVNGMISHRLRSALFGQMLGVGYGFIAANDAGRLANTLDTESALTSKALEVLASLIIKACAVLAFVVLLLLMSWRLTLVIMGGALLLSLLVRLLVDRAHRLGHARVEASAALSERIWDALTAMRLVRIFGQENREQTRFDAASERMRQAILRMQLISGLTRPVLEAVYAPLFLATFVYAWYSGIHLATLLTFLALAYRLQPHIKGLDESRVQLATLAAAVDDVAAMLETCGKPYTRSGARHFTGMREDIAFDRVSFRYDTSAGRPALHDLSFRIVKGSVTAVVGPSGAGKSTLINLLCRLYDPTSGEIRVDGVPLRELDLAAWRSRLALAGQDLGLINGTVRANIAYGRPEVDDVALRAAARRADAHGFIEALHAGYETPVGDRGVRLSGGQRQRIALARALLRDPEMLILDEATNAVDSLSEAEIQRVLDRLAGHLTMVIIAHRMSTIRSADNVIVLADGRLAESGRPSELFRARGPFARLYQLQRAGDLPHA